MMLRIELGKFRLILEVPHIGYVLVAAVTIAIIGAAALGHPFDAEVGMGKVWLAPRQVINQTSKSDRMPTPFDERFGEFKKIEPPVIIPWLAPLAGLPSEWPATPAAPIKKAKGHYYEISPKSQGDAENVELRVIKRRCIRPSQFPPPCHFPQKVRWKMPVNKF